MNLIQLAVRQPKTIAVGVILALLGGLMAVAALNGCAANYVTPVKPPTGFLYSKYSAPLTVNFNNTPCDESLIKASESKTFFVHDWLLTGISVAWGDADVARVAREAGIVEIAYADHEFLNILGFYATFTINVYGQGAETTKAEPQNEATPTVEVASVN